jgi:hypothetical protein
MPKELNLNSNVEVLVVNIGDKTFNVPLATSLPYKKAKALLKLAKADEENALDGFLEFFSQYIPSEVLDELTMKDLTALAKAWSGQTEKEGGQPLGE